MTLRRIDVTKEDRRAGPDDAEPRLDWIPIKSLRINHAYQRSIEKRGWATIRKIAANFSWARFGALDVTDAGGGEYDIIDGQHRAHAAAICGIEAVPALIKTLSEQEAASAFSWINGAVTALTPCQKFRAALAAMEPWAIQSEAVVAKSGCRLMTSNKSSKDRKPGEVFCIGAIRKMVEEEQSVFLSTVLNVLIASPDLRHPVWWFNALPLRALTSFAIDRGITQPDRMATFFGAHDPWEIYMAALRLRDTNKPGYVSLTEVKAFETLLIERFRDWQMQQASA